MVCASVLFLVPPGDPSFGCSTPSFGCIAVEHALFMLSFCFVQQSRLQICETEFVYTYSVVSFRHGRTGLEPRVHVSLAQTSVVVFSPKGNKYISLITPNMIYDTKGAAWGRLVGHKDKRMQTFIAFWGLDSAFGQMRQLGMLSDDEIRVLSPPFMGSKKVQIIC